MDGSVLHLNQDGACLARSPCGSKNEVDPDLSYLAGNNQNHPCVAFRKDNLRGQQSSKCERPDDLDDIRTVTCYCAQGIDTQNISSAKNHPPRQLARVRSFKKGSATCHRSGRSNNNQDVLVHRPIVGFSDIGRGPIRPNARINKAAKFVIGLIDIGSSNDRLSVNSDGGR